MSQDTTETITTECVAKAIRRGRAEPGGTWKIHAIRYLRIVTGAGLKEAKELIERYQETGDCRTEDEIVRARLAEAEVTIGRLTGPEARERLARRIYLDAHPGDVYAQRHWDFGGDQHVTREPWLARADLYLAVVAGTKD